MGRKDGEGKGEIGNEFMERGRGKMGRKDGEGKGKLGKKRLWKEEKQGGRRGYKKEERK